MRSVYITLIILLFCTFSHSTTYLKLNVAGKPAGSMVQGEAFGWEYDVSVIGATASFSIYLDLDENNMISLGDQRLIEFEQTDGQASQDGPPPDTGPADGKIVTEIGLFGFAPAKYLFQVVDQNNQSEQLAALTISELQNVTIWFEGSVSKSNKEAPDPALTNIMVQADSDMESMGFWSGLTDQFGNYKINLPDSADLSDWQVKIDFDDYLNGYVLEKDRYEDISLSPGANGPFDFMLATPESYIYGSVIDNHGHTVNIDDYGMIENLLSGNYTEFEIKEGKYAAPVIFDSHDSVNVPFQLHLWGQNFIPDFLVPETHRDPQYTYYLNKGDSVAGNIFVQATDGIIYVKVTKDGFQSDGTYEASAHHQTVGRTWSNTDEQGNGQLSIYGSGAYNVYLQTEDDGKSTLPEGYIIENGNGRTKSVGDTAYFNLIPGTSMLAGKITFKDGDASKFDSDNAEIQAGEKDGGQWYSTSVDDQTFEYKLYLPNNTFELQFESWQEMFLAKPFRYENISVENDTIDSLDFELNYAHAEIVVKLKNAPPNVIDEWRWWNLNTNGDYPNIYQAYAEIQFDTTYYFKVCEGDWHVNPPHPGEDYILLDSDSVIAVNSEVETHYIKFNYQKISSIVSDSKHPAEFYVKQNYPNPFNPLTTIKFGLKAQCLVRVEIYDISGKKIDTILDKELNAGHHSVEWNAGLFASGMYVYRVISDKNIITKKLLLLK